MISSIDNVRWKNLNTNYLRKQFSKSPETYKNIITALSIPLKEGAIIECDYDYSPGVKSRGFRIRQPYLKRGLKSYELKTTEAIKLLQKRKLSLQKRVESNAIVKNLLNLYPKITLPSINEIRAEAKRLVKIPYIKKGKQLVFANNHPKSYYKNPEKLSFVEDAISIFRYLTEDGYLFPSVGSAANGGRIVDSFTLMPSWIRRLIKIDGYSVIECDYSCLHPNILLRLNGINKTITHSHIDDFLKQDDGRGKIEHLSFFNKEVWQMKKSPIFPYYEKELPYMLNNIISEKYTSEFKHKITSRVMFKKEVEIMTDAISELNNFGVYVGYIYDAVFCRADQSLFVKEVMDETIRKHKINISSKLSSQGKNSKFIQFLKGRITSVGDGIIRA